MSTPFYDLASLVVVPSGYKASKVYAQKPLTTDGQLTFSRASTATRVNSAGLIETVSSNVPRLDYLNSSCPKLQLEPQRTNLISYSSAFDDASWTKLNTTVTANAAVSPDGTSNADQLTDDATNGPHLAYKILSYRSTGTAWSVFMKKGTLNFGFIGNIQSSTDFTTAVIDLTNGTVKELQNGSGNTGSVTVQNYGNGWYRVIMQSTANGGGTSIGCSDGSALSGTTKDAIYTGTGKHIFVWGAQLEDAAYTSSFIPTTTAAVTRLKDNCVKTGVSSLIGQTEGTVFVEWTQNSLETSEDLYSNNKNLTGSISLQIGSTGILSAFVCYNNAYIVIGTPSGTIQLGQSYKVAYAYKSGSIALYLNGALIGTSSASFAFTTTLSEIDIANNLVYFASAANKKVSQLLQFKTRLTNAQLAELTAL